MKVTAIILAAGEGTRFGEETPKQLIKLAGRSVLEHTCLVFQSEPMIDDIVIVTSKGLVSLVREQISKRTFSKVQKIIVGGKTRNESTYAAIRTLEQEDDGHVLIHDAVRPFLNSKTLQSTILALKSNDAVDVAIPSADTIINVNDGYISHIPDRSKLRRGQTPQAFKLRVLREAYEMAIEDDSLNATDDCGLVAKYLPEVPIKVTEGDESNIKITNPIDIYIADKLFQVRSQESVTLDDHALASSFRGKVVVVIGGNYGIGLNIFEMAIKAGAKCVKLSRSISSTYVESIASLNNSFSDIFESHGRIDYIVNTSGLLKIKSLKSLSDAEIDEMIAVNYLGVVNVARVSERYLAESHGGLVNFTSSSFTRGRANYSIYSSCKAAIVNFTQAIAEEWVNSGISINCINPERTLTPMRFSNFGNEDPSTLLDADAVAHATLQTLAGDFTGQVIDVRI